MGKSLNSRAQLDASISQNVIMKKVCPICQISFVRLDRHMRNIHKSSRNSLNQRKNKHKIILKAILLLIKFFESLDHQDEGILLQV